MRPFQQRLRQHINKVGGANYANDQLRKRAQMVDTADLNGLLNEGFITQEDYDRFEFQARKARKEEEWYRYEQWAQQQAELEQIHQNWLNDTSRKAKTRDLQSLENVLSGGAYGDIGQGREIRNQQEYVDEILSKYGSDSELITLLNKYNWEIESDYEGKGFCGTHNSDTGREVSDERLETKVSGSEIGERSQNLRTYWGKEGVNLNKKDWLEVAERVGAGEGVRDVFDDYGFAEKYDNYTGVSQTDEEKEFSSKCKEASRRILNGDGIESVLADYGLTTNSQWKEAIARIMNGENVRNVLVSYGFI